MINLHTQFIYSKIINLIISKCLNCEHNITYEELLPHYDKIDLAIIKLLISACIFNYFFCYLKLINCKALYSFWHFDDFSWGNTRVVQDNAQDSDDDEYAVPLQKWGREGTPETIGNDVNDCEIQVDPFPVPNLNRSTTSAPVIPEEVAQSAKYITASRKVLNWKISKESV